MRTLLTVVVLAMLDAGCTDGQPIARLAPRLLRDSLAARILTVGEEQNLQELEGARKQVLFVRLYRVGMEGGCVEETHRICSYDYYLAVGDLGVGEDSDYALFYLGSVGELRDLRWLERVGLRAQLGAVVSDYPSHALEAQPNLKANERAVVFDIGLDSVRIRHDPHRPR